MSYFSNGTDSPNGEEDIVVHCDDYDPELEMEEMNHESRSETQHAEIPEVTLTPAYNSLPDRTSDKSMYSFKGES